MKNFILQISFVKTLLSIYTYSITQPITQTNFVVNVSLSPFKILKIKRPQTLNKSNESND